MRDADPRSCENVEIKGRGATYQLLIKITINSPLVRKISYHAPSGKPNEQRKTRSTKRETVNVLESNCRSIRACGKSLSYILSCAILGAAKLQDTHSSEGTHLYVMMS